eukprot:g12344.t1
MKNGVGNGRPSVHTTSLLVYHGDTSAERVSVSTDSPLEPENIVGMRNALAEIEVPDVFKVKIYDGTFFGGQDLVEWLCARLKQELTFGAAVRKELEQERLSSSQEFDRLSALEKEIKKTLEEKSAELETVERRLVDMTEALRFQKQLRVKEMHENQVRTGCHVREAEDANFRKTLTQTIEREDSFLRLKRRLHAAETEKREWDTRMTRLQREADRLRATLWAHGINPGYTAPGNNSNTIPTANSKQSLAPKGFHRRAKHGHGKPRDKKNQHHRLDPHHHQKKKLAPLSRLGGGSGSDSSSLGASGAEIGAYWASRPFSHEEHSSFLDAMELYGQESTGREWEKITEAVGNGRTVQDVRMHAHEYFVNLQMVTQMEPDNRVLGSKMKRDDWTFEQDMVFEHAMAEFEETDPLRWLKVASLLPGKNHEDVRYRYQRLVYDVHKIENAMPMEVKYKAPKGGKSLLAKVAAKSSFASGRARGGGAPKSGGYGFHGGGNDLSDGGREGGSAMKDLSRPRAVGKGRGGARLEGGEREAKPKGPNKNKIKGKGGGYLLNNKSSSSPRGSSRGGNSFSRSQVGKGAAAAPASAAGGSSSGAIPTPPGGGPGPGPGPGPGTGRGLAGRGRGGGAGDANTPKDEDGDGAISSLAEGDSTDTDNNACNSNAGGGGGGEVFTPPRGGPGRGGKALSGRGKGLSGRGKGLSGRGKGLAGRGKGLAGRGRGGSAVGAVARGGGGGGGGGASGRGSGSGGGAGRGGSGGKGGSTSSSALKRSAVAHLANLKRARLNDDTTSNSSSNSNVLPSPRQQRAATNSERAVAAAAPAGGRGASRASRGGRGAAARGGAGGGAGGGEGGEAGRLAAEVVAAPAVAAAGALAAGRERRR